MSGPRACATPLQVVEIRVGAPSSHRGCSCAVGLAPGRGVTWADRPLQSTAAAPCTLHRPGAGAGLACLAFLSHPKSPNLDVSPPNPCAAGPGREVCWGDPPRGACAARGLRPPRPQHCSGPGPSLEKVSSYPILDPAEIPQSELLGALPEVTRNLPRLLSPPDTVHSLSRSRGQDAVAGNSHLVRLRCTSWRCLH